MPVRKTLEDLQRQLDAESAWRKRELGTLEAMLSTARVHEAEMLRRAAVALAYAHWEGFVKAAGESVLRYVAEQKLTRANINDALLASSLSAKLRNAAAAKKNQMLVEVISDLRSSLTERCIVKTSVATASNLNREVFDDVMRGMGIDPESVWSARPGVTDIDLDDRLLRRRNNIAHGAWLAPEDDECRSIVDAVRSLIDATSVAYSNFAALRQFEQPA